MGEFSPIGLLFSMVRFFLNCRKRPTFGLLFSTEKRHALILANKLVGLHQGCQMFYFQTKNPNLVEFGGP
jgi:hypothetical protein